MRGITTPVTKIRRQVFTEIARLAYEDGDYSRIEELPYTIIPGEKANYRDSVFKERAIVGERLRLAVRVLDDLARRSSTASGGPARTGITGNQ